jgi:hypothetical protein
MLRTLQVKIGHGDLLADLVNSPKHLPQEISPAIDPAYFFRRKSKRPVLSLP